MEPFCIRARVCSLVGLLTLAACGSRGEAPPSLPLRPGVREILSWDQDGLDFVLRPVLEDVAIEGDLMVILYGDFAWAGDAYSGSPGLAWSLDGGATWHRDADDDIGWRRTNFPVGVEILGGVPYLFFATDEGPFEIHRVAFDGDSATLAPSAIVPAGEYLFDGDAAIYVDARYESAAVVNVDVWRYPAPDFVRTEQLHTTFAPSPDDVPCMPLHWYPAPIVGTPRRFVGGCAGQDPRTGSAAWCTHVLTPPDLVPLHTCVPDDLDVARAHPEFSSVSSYVVIPGVFDGLVMPGEGPAATVAAYSSRTDAAGRTALTREPIGPGTLVSPPPGAAYPGGARQRYGSLVGVVESLPGDLRRTTLYRFSSAERRFVPSGLPTRPCADADECGWRPIWGEGGDRFESALLWAAPVGERDLQMFYVVDTSPPSSNHRHVVLLTSREHLDVPVAAGAPAGDLERACARASACVEGGGDGALSCVERWLDVSAGDDTRLPAFLAATSCAELAAVDPTYLSPASAPSCPTEGPSCMFDTPGDCVGGRWLPGAVGPCTARRATCIVTAGDGAFCGSAGVCDASSVGCTADGSGSCSTVSFVGCAPGESCAPRGGTYSCGGSRPSCMGAGLACDGDVLVACAAAGTGSATRDCTRVAGLSCDPTASGGCRSATPDCDPIELPPTCEGDVLRYCLGGSTRALDCRALGLGCVAGATGRDGCR